jgi:hypothetical protein
MKKCFIDPGIHLIHSILIFRFMWAVLRQPNCFFTTFHLISVTLLWPGQPYESLLLFPALSLPEQIKGKSDLLRVLDDYGVGDMVTLTIRRGAETEVALSLIN